MNEPRDECPVCGEEHTREERVCPDCGLPWYPSMLCSDRFPGSACDLGECEPLGEDL